MIYIGIDPGAKGGWSVIGSEIKQEASSHIWDEASFIEDMKNLINVQKPSLIRCCLEKVGAMPKQGVSSTFKFGEEYGKIQGILMALGIPYQTVTPQMWKKDFSLLHQDKDKSIETAQRLFPGVNLFPTPRCKNRSDGMAESLLMAEYARRHF